MTLPIAPPFWRARPAHRRWLAAEADSLLAFYEPDLIDPKGGFANLDARGRPLASERVRPLHETTRMVHCFAIAHLLGRPGAADIVDHGVKAIRERHRDAKHGGYFWSFDDDGPRERDKLAYGHAFVLLAAASAKCVGHPDADALLADIAEVLETRFWDQAHGASAEEFREDWTPFSDYRGQNANMHLTEALMAAFEATGDGGFLAKAESIADLILRRSAAACDWRVPEHYRADWTVDRDYKGSDMFRPYGVTPGHALEWTRLALQLWALGGRRLGWLPDAARGLFARALAEGWDKSAGRRLLHARMERRAARARPAVVAGAARESARRRFSARSTAARRSRRGIGACGSFAARHFIDRRDGGWLPQLDDSLTPIAGYFVGKPDLYHALQACLIPLYPTDGSLTRGILGEVKGMA